MVFAQVVLGPPGSGKTTYSFAAKEFMVSNLGRKVCVVNLDPACEGHEAPQTPEGADKASHDKTTEPASATSSTTTTSVGSEAAPDSKGHPSSKGSVEPARTFDVDIRELVRVDEVMQRLDVGPNAALIFCMEFLEQNLGWLKEKLDGYRGHTFVLDCPGQVELYTHHRMMRNIVKEMEEQWHFRVCCVHLVDSYMCSEPSNFMSALLVSMSAMMMLELPHVNVLSKIDLVEAYGKLHFNLDFYTEVLDLHYLMEHMETGSGKTGVRRQRYKQLTEALAEMVQDFALVHFVTLDVQSPKLMLKLVQAVDASLGNLYTGAGQDSIELESAVLSQPPLHQTHAFTTQQQYMDS